MFDPLLFEVVFFANTSVCRHIFGFILSYFPVEVAFI